MPWEMTDDVETFAEAAGKFLRSRPVEHTVPLTLVDALHRHGRHAFGPDDPIFGVWRAADGGVAGMLLQTPPHPVLFSAVPAEALPAAVDALADRPLPGANLLARDADPFVAGWRERTGVMASVRMRTRLYRLGTLTPPAVPPPGSARAAEPRDRALVLRWTTEFLAEIGEGHSDTETAVDEWISDGGVTLWETGEPVSMATRSRSEAGMVRIRAVYTPRPFRGRGYAGAATTAATRAALDAGAHDVVLYTDLANATSNALYERLGYRPVEDRTVMEFSS